MVNRRQTPSTWCVIGWRRLAGSWGDDYRWRSDDDRRCTAWHRTPFSTIQIRWCDVTVGNGTLPLVQTVIRKDHNGGFDLINSGTNITTLIANETEIEFRMEQSLYAWENHYLWSYGQAVFTVDTPVTYDIVGTYVTSVKSHRQKGAARVSLALD